MKKIILIITLTFLIFQMVVLATAIDIGSPAIDRASNWGGLQNHTMVNKDNPANESGKITSVEIWAYSSLVDCSVATFYVVSGNNLSTRDTEYIGAVASGSKQTFGVDLDVEAGDYIGIYFGSADKMEYTSTGYSGVWYIYEDQIPCTNVAFTLLGTRTISLYGTGETTEAEDNAIFFGMDF